MVITGCARHTATRNFEKHMLLVKYAQSLTWQDSTESVRLYNAKSQLVTYAVFVKSSTYNIKSIQNDNAYSFKVCA